MHQQRICVLIGIDSLAGYVLRGVVRGGGVCSFQRRISKEISVAVEGMPTLLGSIPTHFAISTYQLMHVSNSSIYPWATIIGWNGQTEPHTRGRWIMAVCLDVRICWTVHLRLESWAYRDLGKVFIKDRPTPNPLIRLSTVLPGVCMRCMR